MKSKRFARRDFLTAAGAGMAAAALQGCLGGFTLRKAAGPNTKPNFVFIFIDDLGWKDLGFMGSRYYETPNIDKLAGEGLVFTNAYANAPNCAPTRACLMSGQYSPRHGIYTVGTSERGESRLRKLIPTENNTELNPDVVTLAEALKGAGYTSSMVGKWHLGGGQSRPENQGFDSVFSWQFWNKGYFGPNGQYLTDVLTDQAIDFMEQNRDRPFFLYLAHHAVHTPIQAKEEIIDKYRKKQGVGGHNNPEYAAMIESVDQSVGRIMKNLDKCGLGKNTVVFFFSDNGGYGNATTMTPLRGSKGMLYEGGIRVPMIVRWLGKIKRGTCDVPVIGIDFYPTLLELGGAGRPEKHILDGESIVPLLKGRKSLGRKAIFWHFPAYLEPYNNAQGIWRTTPAGAVRMGDWKLIEFFEDGTLELYNLKDDIGEKHNLARHNPKKARDLHELMKNWRESVNAPVPRELNPEYNP